MASLKVEPMHNSNKLDISTRDEDETNGEQTCVLCLGTRKHSSLTTCGHIFCWE